MKTFPPNENGLQRAFSLVELLTVMALVALLSGATAMMFSGGRSTGITTSAVQISSALAMARDLAVTSNRRTRFIIVDEADGNPAALRRKSYGILQFDSASSQWALVHPLEHLPTGVVFGEDPENEAAGRGVFDFRDQTTLRGGVVEYVYLEFLPAGGTTANSGANIFSLVGDAGPDQPAPATMDYARLGVAQHTGRVKVERN